MVSTAEASLAALVPLLNTAVQALDTMTKADINEIKGMRHPPMAVKLVLEAVCILKGVKPAQTVDRATNQTIIDYWPSCRKMLQDEGFVDSLRWFDRDSISPAVLRQVKTYTSNDMFDTDKVQKVSKAACGLCAWVRAMEAYGTTMQAVRPKQEQGRKEGSADADNTSQLSPPATPGAAASAATMSRAKSAKALVSEPATNMDRAKSGKAPALAEGTTRMERAKSAKGAAAAEFTSSMSRAKSGKGAGALERACDAASRMERAKSGKASPLAEGATKMERAKSAKCSMTVEGVTLERDDIKQIRGMRTPPNTVKLVLEAVCVLKGVKPVVGKDRETGQTTVDYWTAAQKMMMDEKEFMASLGVYDKHHMEPAVLKKVQTYVESEALEPENVKKVCAAAYGLCMWVHSIAASGKSLEVTLPPLQQPAELDLSSTASPAGTTPPLSPFAQTQTSAKGTTVSEASTPKSTAAAAQLSRPITPRNPAPKDESTRIITQLPDLSTLAAAEQAAFEALNSITKNDIKEMASWSRPPTGVTMVLTPICMLLGVMPGKEKDPESGNMVDTYQRASQKMLVAPGFLRSLIEFDKDNINPAVLRRVQAITSSESFRPECIQQISKTACGLCHWVHTIVAYATLKGQAASTSPEAAALAVGAATESAGAQSDQQALICVEQCRAVSCWVYGKPAPCPSARCSCGSSSSSSSRVQVVRSAQGNHKTLYTVEEPDDDSAPQEGHNLDAHSTSCWVYGTCDSCSSCSSGSVGCDRCQVQVGSHSCGSKPALSNKPWSASQAVCRMAPQVKLPQLPVVLNAADLGLKSPGAAPESAMASLCCGKKAACTSISSSSGVSSGKARPGDFNIPAVWPQQQYTQQQGVQMFQIAVDPERAVAPQLVWSKQDSLRMMKSAAVLGVPVAGQKGQLSYESQQVQEAPVLQAPAGHDLGRVMSAATAAALWKLDAAHEVLKGLTQGDLSELGRMRRPPAGVEAVLEAVCVLKGVEPIQMEDRKSGQVVEVYPPAAKKMIQDKKFISSLIAFDKDHVDPAVLEKVQQYTALPEAQPEALQQESKAAYALSCWVRGVEAYGKAAGL